MMKVKRILPFRSRRMVGPFIFMDHAGPVDVAPAVSRSLDVLPHPHIGLSTVSYLFGGQVTHRDSLGVEQIIRPGEVNWMTAGRGIAHSERFEDPTALSGGNLEMIQTWVALPEKDEEAAPAFDNYTPEQLPVFSERGVWMRLIAGNAFGLYHFECSARERRGVFKTFGMRNTPAGRHPVYFTRPDDLLNTEAVAVRYLPAKQIAHGR